MKRLRQPFMIAITTLIATSIPLSLLSAAPSIPIPAIPQLAGFGSLTVGGSGRHLPRTKTAIIPITTLRDSGPGSLRACAEGHGPRTCVSFVGGVIHLTKSIKVTSPYLTIAGQSAPWPGLTLINAGISIEASDVVIQHISIRPGDSRIGAPPGERDGVSIGAPPPKSVHNVALDHLSLTWAIDENISTAYRSTRDITISNSIIAQGLHRSIHPKGPHSKGVMVGDGSQRITIQRNLIAFNEERNPYLKPDTSVEFINNVVYGWGERGGWSLCNLTNNTGHPGKILLTFVGNVYRPAPYSVRVPPIYAKRIDPESLIYMRDNISAYQDDLGLSRRSSSVDITTITTRTPPLENALRSSIDGASTFDTIIAKAGSRPAERDRIDFMIIEEVLKGGGSLKDCTTGCKRATGTTRSNLKTYRRLRIPHHPNSDTNGDGYTDLENWLQSMARDLE